MKKSLKMWIATVATLAAAATVGLAAPADGGSVAEARIPAGCC